MGTSVNPLVSPFSFYRKHKLKPNYDQKIPVENGVEQGESETYNDGKVGVTICIHVL